MKRKRIQETVAWWQSCTAVRSPCKVRNEPRPSPSLRFMEADHHRRLSYTIIGLLVTIIVFMPLEYDNPARFVSFTKCEVVQVNIETVRHSRTRRVLLGCVPRLGFLITRLRVCFVSRNEIHRNTSSKVNIYTNNIPFLQAHLATIICNVHC